MKKHLLFNQLFGTVGSPNQTGETLTRENRIGLMSYLRRTLMLLFAVLVMSVANVGMAWGAVTVLSGYTTKSYAEKTFLDVAGTIANTRISKADSTVTYNCFHVLSQSSIPAWAVGTKDRQSTKSSMSKLPDNGFIAEASGSTGDGETNTSVYSSTKVHSTQTLIFYVTGITSIAIVGKGAGTNDNKWIGIGVEEVASNGDLTTIAQAVNNKNYTNSAAITIVSSFEEGKSISPDKYYKVTITSGQSSSKCFVWQVRFGKPLKVTNSLTNVTKTDGSTLTPYGKSYNATFAAADGYTLPSTITVTIGGNAATAVTDYTWDASTGAFQVFAEKVTGAIEVTITGASAGGGDVTAPTLSSSSPANDATNVATSGNITLTFSENVTIVDASKFSLSGGTGTLNTASASASGAVVTIPYSGLANNTSYTLTTDAGAVKDASNNTSAALSDITFTTVKASHTVTAVSNNDSYGTVSATNSSVAEGSTTTITATPATGYQVTNWAVSGTGASISPDGASNSNTTTLTMGTANATVTATFGPKSYTVTLNNQSATTAGMESVTTTYNSNTNLTSAITKPTKTGYVFAGYFTGTNGTGIQLIDPAGNWIASAGGGSTYMNGEKNWKNDGNLTLYACWMEYCPGMDMAAEAIRLGSGEHKTWTNLTTNKILYSLSGNTAFDDSSDASNAYDGLKFKNNGDYILFLVQANSSLKLYFGYTDTKPKISINGGAESDVNVTSTQSKTPNQEVDFGTQTYDRLIKLRTVTSSTVVLQKISSGACPSAYSFHYGPAVGAWETPICFEQVGSTHEWNITNFTIPNHTNGQFYVGYAGSTNGQSATKAWTDSYSESNGVGNGAMLLLPTNGSVVGNAVGATGTLVIWDNSSSKNQYVGFKPDGYSIRYSGTDHVFTETATANKWETDVVTLPDVSTTYTMEIKTAGGYTTCYHSNAAEAISNMGVTVKDGGKKAIYLIPGSFDDAGAKYAVYDVTNGVFDSDFMTDDDGDGIYVGYVGDNCASIVLCRMKSDATTTDLADKNWEGARWNQTANISISGDLAKKYTITNMTTWNACAYTTANMQPITGQKGKFRMWANSNDNNWYVHFIPYYVLSYNANGGSGTTAQTERNSESSTLTVSVASNGFTAPEGYYFYGWNPNETQADAGTKNDSYDPSDNVTLSVDVTLYAVWKPILVTAISVSPSSKTLDVSETVTLSATATPSTALDKTVTWSTSDEGVATVTSAGVVTAVAPGTATITATAHDGSGVTGTCSITVNKITPTKYDFSVDKTSLCLGTTATLTLEDSEVGATYELRSDATHSIADTEQEGTGDALVWEDLGVGSYVVYAIDNGTYSERQMNSSKITITAATATSISSQPNGIADATVGEEQTLSVTAAGTNLSYQWQESATEDGTYTDVDSDGTSASYSVTPAAAGTKWYKCVVTGDCGEVTSNKVSIVAAAASEAPIPALISYYLQTPNKSTTPASLSTDSIITTPARLKGDTLRNFVPVTLGSSLGITKAGKGDGGTWSAGIGTTPTDSATAVTDAYAAKLAFDIHDDYELNISSITLNVKSVTNASQIYRVKVSDGVNTVYGRVAPEQDSDNSVVFGSFSGIKFSGTVTLTLWVWSNAAAEYRLKSPIQIDGTLTRKAAACTMPTQTFCTGAYTLGGDALDLSTLFTSNSDGAVTYSVVSAGGTSAAIVGSSFTASNAGTATVRATQAAAGVGNYCAKSIETTITVSGTCTPQSLSKVSATKGTSGTVTGYNDGQYAGDAVVNLYSKSPQSASLSGVGDVDGYKMGDAGTSIVFATLKGTSFQEGDKVKIGITRRNDLRQVNSKYNILTIYYGTDKSDAAALTTITTGGDNDNGAADDEGAGFYEYTLTAEDVTTIGSKKGIGLFRESGDNGENPYVYSVEIIGCREWAVCTAPNAVAASGATHNSALLTVTDAAATGNYEFYYSTSNTAPTASTAATATGSSPTKTITGLSASTTYYYWVRSNCGGVTKSAWVAGTPATFTTTAAPSTYSVTYSGNGKTGGDVPTDATAYEEGDVVTVKGNTGSLVKSSSSFVGWNTASDGTGVFYPAGYKFYMGNANVTLYAVWGSVGSRTVNIAYFETSLHNYNSTTKKPDAAGKYLYGYTNSAKTGAYAYTLTTTSTDNKGQGTGASDYLRMNYGTTVTVYADSVTKYGTPASFEDVTAVSVDFKMLNKSYYTNFDIYVGSTKIADNVSLAGDAQTAFKTYTYSGLSNLDGVVKIVNKGSGSSNYHFYVDNISISYGSGAGSGHTVSFNMNGHGSAIADIENVPDGSKIGAPVPEPTATDWDFGGWYNEEGCSSVFNFASTTITADKTLYAKWGNCAPTITTHPVSANYNQNGVAAALTVAANDNGGGTLHYQWWVKENDLADEDGSVIPGETGTSFTPSTELLGTSYYYCVVSNDCGNVKTNTAEVTIRDAKPAPTAVWDVDEPTHGGKGFTFSVIAKNDDGTDLWDGTLTEEMLSVSSEAVLGDVEVNNTTKTISGTYGVKASATSPVTFYLLLPATETFAAKRLDYDRTFTACVGGDGSTYRVPVRKDSEKDASNNYRWVTAGAGEISYTYGSTISSGKATSSYNSFDSIVSSDKQNLYVRTYNANIKKVTLYVLTGGKDITVESIYKQTSYKGADDKDKLSTAAYSVTYDDGSDENTGAKGNHYIVITLEDPLEANDILMFKFSKSNVKAYGAVFTQTADGGTETPTLGWSPSIDGNVEKNENAADFTYTATRSNDEAVASLGIISYSSSNTTVATVNATTGQVTIADNIDFGSADHIDVTITATLSASGCYKKATTTYTLRVKKYVCSEAVGTVDIQTDNACSGKVLAVSGYEAGATIQWYKNGAAIPGEIGTTYTATTAGAYYVVTHKDCDAVSNEITINFGAAAATKIVDSWYIKNGRRTPDIALVQTTNATGFTVTSSGDPVTEIGGCTFELKEDGIIYLHGTTSTGAAPSGMTPGDMTITITATACSNAAPLDIVLHIQPETAKPTIAFVVDGTLRKDGGTATSVLEAKTSERPLWKYLENTFALTGCNAYWSVDSKELRQYYSQFDAILITDDPSTDTKGTGGVSYVKAFGTMVDVRPVLTMEAYVGKFKDGGWHVYDATPSSPNPRQVELKLECKNHDIFKGLNPATSDNVRTTTDEYGNEYWHVIMVDTTQSPYHNTKDSYEALPALQGFDRTKFSNMLGVGTIFEEKLQGGVERQEEPAARMMILGIQNNAMGALTNEGKLIVKNALEYLLKTNMEDVNDCSNYFTNADGDSQWSNGANWTRGEVPDFETRARILKPVTIGDGTTAIAARVDIAARGESKHVDGECNGSITIEPQGILKVGGKVTRAKAPYFGIDDLQPTQPEDLYLTTNTSNQSALIFDNSDGNTQAVVQVYSKAHKDGDNRHWQYLTSPLMQAPVTEFFYGIGTYTFKYEEAQNGWVRYNLGTTFEAFDAIGLTQNETKNFVFYGPLASTEDRELNLTYEYNGENMFGNSWTAPLQLTQFDDDDFEGDIERTFYVYNTGFDAVEGTGAHTNASNTPGEWQSIPLSSLEVLTGDGAWEGLKVVPAYQAFYVKCTSAGTITLNYDKHVRPATHDVNESLRAPKRAMSVKMDVLGMRISVENTSRRSSIYLLEDEDFTEGFDNGWDGDYFSGDANVSRFYSVSPLGRMAVSALPNLDGTALGFEPASMNEEYTFTFYCDEDKYYLNDLKMETSTPIRTGESYTFMSEEGDGANRFYISATPFASPQITTGSENLDAAAPKVQKIIYNDKLYIIRGGKVYSADGQVVK